MIGVTKNLGNKDYFILKCANYHMVLAVLIAFFLVGILATKSTAADITLHWTKNSEPDIAGYKIYYGTKSQTYQNIITINDSSNDPYGEYTIHGLEDGQTYYFALKAFDISGNESVYSAEVSANTSENSHDGLHGNIVTNGTMEEGADEPEGWSLFDVPYHNSSVNPNPGEWATDEAFDGSHSLMLRNETGSYLGWTGEKITFSQPYPKTLAFGGWSKSENVQPGARYCIAFKVVFENHDYTWLYKPLKFDLGTHDWQLKYVIKTWARGVRSVQPFALLYYSSGTVWFDDIFVIPSPDNFVYNGNCEDDSFGGWGLFNVNYHQRQTTTNPGGWVTDEAHSGSYSLKLHNGNGNYVGWVGEKTVFEEPYPKTLTFGGWSKAENVQIGAAYCLAFKITFENGDYIWLYRPFKFDLGTHDWQLKQETFTWSEGVVSVLPAALLYYSSGTVWFDDIFIHGE